MDHRSPTHYTRGSIEVWDIIRDQRLSYHLGNSIKYICRAGYKDSKVDDLKKAIHYLENELEHVIAEQPGHRVPPSVQYTERFEPTFDAAEFDR